MLKDLPVELVYILIAAAVLLFNFFTQQAARRRQAEKPPEEPPKDVTPDDEPLPPIWGRKPSPQAETPDDEPLPPIWGRKPSVPVDLPVPTATANPVRRSEAPIAAPAGSGRRYSRQSLMGTRRDVQNAIVIATIVGPCRAFEPHDVG